MNAYQKERELTDAEYEAVLDEIYGDVEICGMTFSSGHALRELDPTAFRCGKADHESALDEDNPLWCCGQCSEEYDNEEDADVCCVSNPDE